MQNISKLGLGALRQLVVSHQEALAFEIEHGDKQNVIAATRRNLKALLKELEERQPTTYQVWTIKADGTEKRAYNGRKFKVAVKRMDDLTAQCRSGQGEPFSVIEIRALMDGYEPMVSVRGWC